MTVAIIGVFIPIVTVLVIGLLFTTHFYFRSRERQMLIEKGLDAQSIKEFFENKKDHYILMKIGIIIAAFGIGLGLGMALQDSTGSDYWIPFLLFTITGLGFVVANIAAKKLEKPTEQ
jgi:H+/gluconate symporter-like permease